MGNHIETRLIPIIYSNHLAFRIFDLLFLPLSALKFQNNLINPLYSCKSEANCMNVRRTVGSKAVNPDLVIPKFGLLKIAKFVGITYIVENS